MVVLPDADMDQASDAIMGAAYGSAGERCMAISVAVAVGDQVADTLIDKLSPRVRALKVGPGNDPETEMGPLNTKEHFDKVMGFIDQGVKEGAELVVDGRGLNLQGYENGYFMGGSIFDRVTTDMEIYQKEIFGPVLSVVRADDYGAALQMVNDHEFGNGTAIFTRDGDAARHFANSTKIGMVGEALAVRRPSHARARGRALLYQAEDHDGALADRHPLRRGLLDSGHVRRGPGRRVPAAPAHGPIGSIPPVAGRPPAAAPSAWPSPAHGGVSRTGRAGLGVRGGSRRRLRPRACRSRKAREDSIKSYRNST
jgi:hypothetical protein